MVGDPAAELLDEACGDLDASDFVPAAGLNRGSRSQRVELPQQLRGCL